MQVGQAYVVAICACTTYAQAHNHNHNHNHAQPDLSVVSLGQALPRLVSATPGQVPADFWGPRYSLS